MVLFVGAAVMAVAAVAVVAGVTVERWDDQTAPARSTTADTESAVGKAPEAERTKEQPEPVEDLDSAVAAPIEDLAATPEAVSAAPTAAAVAENAAAAGKIEPAELPAERMADPEPVETPERVAAVDPAAPEPQPADEGASVAPEPESASEGPSFDVVRMEDDGSLLAAGRAAPGSEVALILNGEVIATMPADDAGEWLIMPEQPLAPGSHELTVEASDATGAGTNSGQVVMLDVPERDPLRPSIEADATEEKPEEKSADPEPVAETEAPPGDADEERVAVAPLPEKDETEVTQTEAPADPLEIPLTLESVDYDENGGIVFSGRAQPGLTVIVYVDNRFVGEVTVGLDGRWGFTGSESIAPGRHTLRADLSDPTGKLSARIILPFVRADSRDIAALVESRRETEDPQPAPDPSPPPAPEATTVPEPVEAASGKAPEVNVIAEEVTPEPEAPAVAESAAREPEPESEAQEVADIAAPGSEPAPEVTAVAEPVVREPELAPPVVAEPAAPKADPEQPVVTAPAAPQPEPEPEPPVMAAPVAPEPEAEPEPQPEAETPDIVVVVEPERDPEPSPAIGEGAPVDAMPEVAAAEYGDLGATDLQAAPLGPGHVVIQPGNNLWRISRVIYGRGIEYTVIYQANRDRIRDPDLIYPGQIFATPGVRPPEEIDPDWREPLSPDDLARRDNAE